ncbi:hypothetical protein HZC30_00480 [Candidatus Woesearchaeota archaeon]|nr:hypothetical protein [Candidatus Woesearchaeota archaeon]
MCNNKRKRDNLIVRGIVKDNLQELTSKCKLIGISGQGDPIFNQNAVFDILKICGRNKQFELITSGNIPQKKFMIFIKNMEEIVKNNGSFLRLRFSLDRHHLSKITHNHFLWLINYFLKEEPSHLELMFRSITTDKDFVEKYVSKELEKANLSFKLENLNAIKTKLIINNKSFFICYQSIVNPTNYGIKDKYDIGTYVDCLEKKYRKDFTLGYICAGEKPGLDITINPNGDVLFYGIETEVIGNINRERVSYERITQFVTNSPAHTNLVLIPFKKILSKLRKDVEFSKSIDRTNNPYWIIRNLSVINKKKLYSILGNIKESET